MDLIQRRYKALLNSISTKYIRNIYNKISWDSRLVGIKGARGVGKTTLMLQRIALAFPDTNKALYVTLDDIWFAGHSLIELAEMASQKGITHLFLDEVHRLPQWQQQIKNIYDLYPDLSVVFTGSSLLVLDHSIADLSRRCLIYSMPVLSFREYLEFEDIKRPVVSLQDILYSHETLTPALTDGIDIMKMFHKYLQGGFYPFYKGESKQNYLVRVSNMISAVIGYDLPAVESIEYSTVLKTKQMLAIVAAQAPSPLNITTLASNMGISKNLAIKILTLLGSSEILRLLYYKAERDPKSMTKPRKILLSNPSIAYALGHADIGKVRESFLAAMLSVEHEIAYPKGGDLIIDSRYLFEVGGKGKGFAQIRNIPDSFVVADDIEFGFGNKIPLWLFGFLY